MCAIDRDHHQNLSTMRLWCPSGSHYLRNKRKTHGVHHVGVYRATQCTSSTHHTSPKVLKEVDELQRGAVVFTDGCSKRVGGWDQARYGFFYGDHHPRNVSAHVPEGETHSNNRGEVRAVLCPLEAKLDFEKMTMVVDSEYIYDALTKHILKWEKAGWRSSSGAVSHSDLWIPVLAQMRRPQQAARFI